MTEKQAVSPVLDAPQEAMRSVDNALSSSAISTMMAAQTAVKAFNPFYSHDTITLRDAKVQPGVQDLHASSRTRNTGEVLAPAGCQIHGGYQEESLIHRHIFKNRVIKCSVDISHESQDWSEHELTSSVIIYGPNYL